MQPGTQSHKDIVSYFSAKAAPPLKATKPKGAPKASFDMFDGFDEESSDGPDLMDFDFSAPSKPKAPVKTIKICLTEEQAPEAPQKLSESEAAHNDLVESFNKTNSELQSLHF